jgi:iron complex outermembrane receptor protein
MKHARILRNAMLSSAASLALASPAYARAAAKVTHEGANGQPTQATAKEAAQPTNSVSTAQADQPVRSTEAKASGEVIIRGVRQPYIGAIPLKDMPQNVQVVSTETLKTVGATKLSSALDLVSGVAQLNNFGGLWDGYAIRGFAGDSNNVPTGLLVNGFPSGRGFSGPRDASSIQQIDVLKGPTSALFGRGEPGGTVNIITKKPLFHEYGYIMLQGGSWNTGRVEADYTHPLTSQLSVRVNGAYEEGDSYRDTVHSKKLFITPSVLWNLSDNTNLSYEFEYAHQEIPFDRGIPIFDNDFARLPPSRYLGEPGDGPMRINVRGHQFQVQHNFSDKWSFLAGAGYRTTELKGVGENPELVASRQPFLSNGEILSRQRRALDFKSRDLTLRAEISGELYTAGLTHHLVLGADYDRFLLDEVQTRFRPPVYNSSSTLQNLNAIDVFNPVYGAYPLPNPYTSNVFNTKETDHSWGVYFYDQLDITRWLKFRAGGRIDQYHQSLINRLKPLTSIAPTNPATQDVHAFSPQLGLVVEPTSTLSFYASYGRGFRPNNGQAFDGSTFAPEKSKSYEAGAKFVSRDKRITASLALYRMDKTNVLTSDPNPAHSGFVVAIGSARSRGVEFDVNARLPNHFNLLVAYAYTDAFSTSLVLDPDFGKTIHPGDPLINVPKNSGNVLLTKGFEIDGHKAMFGGGVQYIGRRLGETAVNYYLPAATLVKLVGSFDVTDHIKVNANIDNLLNKRWFANSYSALWTYPGAPRNFKISATYQF